jgi:adenosylhomocysteine nucleosidase
MYLEHRALGAVLVALVAFPRLALTQSPPIGVLGITSEIAPIEKRLQDSREVVVQGYVFRVGTINDRQVVVGRAGAGKVNASIIATLLIHHFNPSAVLFSGTAGAVDPSLRPGDVVIGASVVQHDAGFQTQEGITRRGMRNPVTGQLDPLHMPTPETLMAVARQSAQGLKLPAITLQDGDRVPRIVEGVIATGDVFLSDAGRLEEIRSSLGAAAIEMEGAAVIQTCRQFNVSCLVIRSVTDQADAQAFNNYKKFLNVASENAAALVVAIITTFHGGFDKPVPLDGAK